MLRNIVTRLPGCGTWPCDEINFIWRHHNAHHTSDCLTPDLATDQVKKYIRRKFSTYKKNNNLDTIVDKTVSNSLRIPFVNEIFPDAKYIYIVRDGIDVVSSFMNMKESSVDIPYILKKIRYAPLIDIPYYAYRFLYKRLFSLFSANSDSYWGPDIESFQSIVKNNDLASVCALQWKSCVDSADAGLNDIPHDRKIYLNYETLVSDIDTQLDTICDFLNISATHEDLNKIRDYVNPSSVGKGRRKIDAELKSKLQKLISGTMHRHNYTI